MPSDVIGRSRYWQNRLHQKITTAGNEYTVSDDRWALEFYYAHKDDSAEALVNAVLTNEKMWDQDLTKIAGLEEKVVADLKKIRTEGAKAAFASCL